MVRDFTHALRDFGSNVRMILIISALIAFVVDGIYPVIFNLYVLRMGFGPEFVGQANSVALIVYALSSLAAGALGTRLGLRATMIIGVLVTLASAAALAATDLLPRTMQAIWLTALFSLLYFGVALYFVNSPPALVNATRSSQRSRVIAVQSAGNNLFATIAGSLAGFIPILAAGWLGWSLATPLPYRIPLLIAAAICLVAVALAITLKPIELHAEQVEGQRTGAPAVAVGFAGTLVILSLIRFLQTTGSGSALTFFNVYMDDGLGVSTALIGMMVAAAHLMAVFMALAVPAITHRLGYGPSSVLATLGLGLSLLPLALIPRWWVGGASFIAMSALGSLRYSAYFVYTMEETPPQRRATMAGAGEFAGGLSFALISLAGGFMIVRIGYSMLFLVAAGVTLSGAAVLALYLRWHKRRHPVIEPPALATGTEAAPAAGADAALAAGAEPQPEPVAVAASEPAA